MGVVKAINRVSSAANNSTANAGESKLTIRNETRATVAMLGMFLR